MRPSRVAFCTAIIVAIWVLAPAARAQAAKLEPGMNVVAKSPDFVLRDETKVIAPRSPIDVYLVEKVDGEAPVRLRCGNRNPWTACLLVASAVFGLTISVWRVA